MSTLHVYIIVWVLGSNLILGKYFLGYISWDLWLSVHCLTCNNCLKLSDRRGKKNILLPIELDSNRDAKVNFLLFFKNAKSELEKANAIFDQLD